MAWIAVGSWVEETDDDKPDVCQVITEQAGARRSAADAHALARLLAEAGNMLPLLRGDIDRYLSRNPMRTADVHPDLCGCERCVNDAKMAIIASIEGRV